jgi:integrase
MATRRQVEIGLDPVTERRRQGGIPTFREAALAVFAENRAGWRNDKHRAQWLSSLEAYAFPVIGDMAVSAVEGPDVRDVLLPIWTKKHETARRVRQRISSVIDWAVCKGFRAASLSMAPLNRSLPTVKPKKTHHRAMAYADVPAFVGSLRRKETVGALALEALILTAARSGEVRGARWGEIDPVERLWTIPGERMKAGCEHVIPLSDPVLAVLERAKAWREAGSDLVFPGQRRGKVLSDMTLTKICRDAGLDVVPHGFRSAFRDWTAETTDFAGELAEKALAHAVANKVEAAYRRGNLLEKRRELMDAWAAYCRHVPAASSS